MNRKVSYVLLVAAFLLPFEVRAKYRIDGAGKMQIYGDEQVLGDSTDLDENSLRDQVDAINFDDSSDEIELEALEGKLVVGNKVETNEELEVNEPEVKSKLLIKAVNNEIMVESNGETATTDLDVAVKKEDNSLVIKRNGTETVIKILPDEVINKLISAKVIDELSEILPMKLGWDLELNKAVYVVNGNSRQKLLGFKKVNLSREILVSAETGEVVSQFENWKTRIVDWLSF
jgi:hypothetical protein